MRRIETASILIGLAAMAAGCTSTDTIGILPHADPSISGDASASTTTAGAPIPGLPDVSANATAAITATRVRFAPVIGASPEALTPLSSRLTTRAGQHRLTVTPAEEGATHIIKGYFSTIAENGQTTVIYVWDVLDPAGNRLHRIQGTQLATGGGGEGWNAVTDTTMQTIADKTVDELVSWLASNSLSANAS